MQVRHFVMDTVQVRHGDLHFVHVFKFRVELNVDIDGYGHME